MTKDEAEEFFRKYGDAPVTQGIPSATLEQVYQAIYRRMFDEGAVLKHVHCERRE